jgi:nucleoside-diphosphate-sugar epimerase
MKIAVIGARGFVGSNVARHLSNSHTVVPVTRNTLDLLDPIAVKDFLKREMFDVVVNCAAVMTDNNSIHDARNNLGMFMNFYQNSNYFGKFINTGSGAEFDRTLDINSILESQLFSRMPKDSYGWGQNIKSRLCYDKKDFYTIRIFNCFGTGEPDTRIFPRLLREGSLEISNDRYFDYFSIQDLNKVIDHCIEYTWSNKDVNAVYEQKYKISEVIDKFCKVNQLDPNFKVVSTNNNNYTGSGHLLSTMSINLDGLEKGLKEYIK